MSHPRISVPGGTFMVTRTTAMGLFLLVPGDVVNQIMEYCLAWALQGRGILLHAVSVESTHFHLVLTDLNGELSEFMQEFNRCTARCLLEYYRKRFPKVRLDSVWSPARSFSAPLLVNRAAILKELIYTFTNPVKDGLVRDYRKWPGLNSRPSDWRRGERTATRPNFYFKNTPETLTYRLEAPRQFDGELERVIADVEQHVREEQAQIATNMAAEGRVPAGVKAVMAVDPLTAPTTPQPRGELDPHVAAGGDPEALKAAIHALKRFRLAYREAWQAFKDGLDAVFPGGTLLMRKRFRVPCEPLDACWCHLASA